MCDVPLEEGVIELLDEVWQGCHGVEELVGVVGGEDVGVCSHDEGL